MSKTSSLSVLSLLILFFFFLSSCTYTQKIRDGRTAVERKQYAVAVKLLDKEYNKSKSRVEKGKLAFILGESFRELNKSDQSIQWFRIAYDNQYGVEALQEYAYALKRAERYEEAIRAFKDLGIEIGSPYEYRREIQACEIAQGWKNVKNPEYTIQLMDFNTGFADYSPSIYKDNQLVITSDRTTSTGDDTYNWTGNSFSDLFLVDLQTKSVTNFDKTINSPDNEGAISFNKNYTEAYFTRCFGSKKEDAHCKLMTSQAVGDNWSPPRTLDFIQDGINYGHPAISDDGKSLYFSCNHPDGWGGYDIWVSEKDGDGEWGPPQLLGRSINTPGNEKFPFIDKDTLYFASDFHPGMGGLDIFKTYRLSNGSWAPAYNLKPPINSGGDDFGIVIDYNTPRPEDVLQIGYFSSTRDLGLGNDDIYRFEKRIPVIEEVVEKPEDIEYKMILDGFVLEKIYQNPIDPNSRVLGRKPLPGAEVNIQFGRKTETAIVGEDGMFTLELEENTNYSFTGSKENYLTNRTTFSTAGIGKDPANPVQRFEVEVVLDKIFLDREIRLENIYYDFDKWDIRDDAKPTLDKLTENLNLNPGIRIQLGSHTDCRGADRYNEDLSQKRAQSAVDYLISKGIDASRLVAKGYGERFPEINCICSRCTEEEHQMNRRTTFKIRRTGA
jgi:peptidoglycan-associated lipoprotein